MVACSYPSEKFPERAPPDHVLCRAFVGGALQPQVLEREDQELIDLTHATLVRLHGLTGPPLLAEVRRHQRAMPQFTLAYGAATSKLEARVGAMPGVELAGSTVNAYGLPDCITSGSEATERVARFLDRTD